jgi:hypothetical protein
MFSGPFGIEQNLNGHFVTTMIVAGKRSAVKVRA